MVFGKNTDKELNGRIFNYSKLIVTKITIIIKGLILKLFLLVLFKQRSLSASNLIKCVRLI